MPLKEGTRLGPYEILAPLGAGGMGEAYRARHQAQPRRGAEDSAVGISHDPDRLMRFTREAQTLATLNHPGITRIYGVEESAGTSGSSGWGR